MAGKPMHARAGREQALAAKESGIDDIVWHNRDGVLKAFVPLDVHRGAVGALEEIAGIADDHPDLQATRWIGEIADGYLRRGRP